jgi:lysophospholipase
MSLKLEGHFYSSDKVKLHYKYWPNSNAKKTLVVTHGQAEHGGCYHRLVEALKGLPLNIICWDLRGHGRSQGQRGYVKSFQQYIFDLNSLVEFIQTESLLDDKDLLFFGHSMGGLIQLSYLADQCERNFCANLLSSPMLGLTVEVPLYKDIAALAANLLLPQLTLFNEIEYHNLTSDESVIQEMMADNLRHDRISPAAYLGSLESIELLRKKIGNINVSTLIQLPEYDPVVDSESTKAFFSLMKGISKKKLIFYKNRKHEIINDIGREEVFSDLIQFIEKN